LIASLSLIAAAVSSAANAQSNVTLYGTLDTGIDYISNQKAATGGHSAWACKAATSEHGSLGLEGTEGSGGGLTAVFDLENGFNIITASSPNGGDDSAVGMGRIFQFPVRVP